MSNEMVVQKAEVIPFDDVQRMGVAIAKSGLFGVKKPEEAIALMLVAQAEGRHPAIAARDYDIIQGRPTKKAEAKVRDFIANGGKIEWIELSDKIAKAKFSHPTGGSVEIPWTIEMAKSAGLLGKDNWKKYPRAMLRARCQSEGITTVFPAASGGLITTEEAYDLDEPSETKPAEIEKEPGKPGRLSSIVEKQTVETTAKPAEEPAKDPEPKPEPKPEPAPEAGLSQGVIEDFKAKPTKNGNQWYAIKVKGEYYNTFSDTIGKAMQELTDKQCEVKVRYKTETKGDKVHRMAFVIEPVPDSEPAEQEVPI